MTRRASYRQGGLALGLSTFSLSHLLLTHLTLILLTPIFCQSNDAPSLLRTREFHVLSEEDVRTLVGLGPPQWTSVSEGHLGKILIPRTCTLLSPRFTSPWIDQGHLQPVV